MHRETRSSVGAYIQSQQACVHERSIEQIKAFPSEANTYEDIFRSCTLSYQLPYWHMGAGI